MSVQSVAFATRAIRRACNPLRLQRLSLGTICCCGAKPEIFFCLGDNCAGSETSHTGFKNETCLYYHVSSKLSIGIRSLSSQVDDKSSEFDNDLDDRFSEPSKESNAVYGNEDESIFDSELSDKESGDIGKLSQNEERSPSDLFKAIIAAPRGYVHCVLDKCVREGKDFGRVEIALTMILLRKRRMYETALQFSEWLKADSQIDFVEKDYVSHLDLLAKVHGLQEAERYVKLIPKSFRGEHVYRTFLGCCVGNYSVKKAERVFNNMRDLGFPITSSTYNQMLLLYKRNDKKKMAEVLILMHKENVKPNLTTYKILIDAKGESKDMRGMEQLVETMKAEGIEPNLDIQAILAKHYICGGFQKKAEAMLKEMEGGNLGEHRSACRALLPLYGGLGDADAVRRVWKVCESNPRFEECTAAIETWGKLKNVDEAESVFDRMLTTWKKLSSRHYSILLDVYVINKMLTKGKDLFKKIADKGLQIDPTIWDALVKLYVEAGEVEKADSMLQKAIQQSKIKPLFRSYAFMMEEYAKRGDIHNAEKIFHQMKQAGYVARLRQFQTLVEAYANAKAPAYGIRERMRANNIFPNKALAAQLAKVDAFRKTDVSSILD